MLAVDVFEVALSKAEAPAFSSLLSASRVAGPTTPIWLRLCAAWNLITAAFVCAPKYPFGFADNNPCAASSSWSAVTSAPDEPGARFVVNMYDGTAAVGIVGVVVCVAALVTITTSVAQELPFSQIVALVLPALSPVTIAFDPLTATDATLGFVLPERV